MPVVLTQEQLWNVVNRFNEKPNISVSELARICVVSRHSVRGILKRYQETGSPVRIVNPRPQRRKLSGEQVEALVEAVREEPFKPLPAIKRKLKLAASESTLSRRLKEAGIKCYKPAKKPKLTESHKDERLDFVTRTEQLDWRTVMFSDECTVSSAQGSGVNFVRRTRGERYAARNIQTVQHSGRESVSIWASFTYEGPGNIVKINGKLDQQQYIRRVLQQHVTPHFKDEHAADIFQHDNSPVHTAVNVQRYLARKEINVMKWPSCSPDLNPIENYWNTLKRQIGEVELPRGSVEVKKEFLWNLVKDTWNELKEGRGRDIIRSYYDSMPKRLRAVRLAGGGSTKY